LRCAFALGSVQERVVASEVGEVGRGIPGVAGPRIEGRGSCKGSLLVSKRCSWWMVKGEVSDAAGTLGGGGWGNRYGGWEVMGGEKAIHFSGKGAQGRLGARAIPAQSGIIRGCTFGGAKGRVGEGKSAEG